MTLLEVDPDLVRPGWSPLVVVLLLGFVLFLLGRSMLKQFGKIDVPADHDPAGDPPSDRGKPAIPDLRSRTPEAGGDPELPEPPGPPGPR